VGGAFLRTLLSGLLYNSAVAFSRFAGRYLLAGILRRGGGLLR